MAEIEYLAMDHPRVDELFGEVRKARQAKEHAGSKRTHGYLVMDGVESALLLAIATVTGRRAVEWLDDPRLQLVSQLAEEHAEDRRAERWAE